MKYECIIVIIIILNGLINELYTKKLKISNNT